jgi:hypothetical protein
LLLDAPWIQVKPESITTDQMTGITSNHKVVISNTGSSTLTFNIIPRGIDPSGMVLWMHLDEPTGSNTFTDSSVNAYHASCSVPTCPTTNVEGIIGQAINFDGIDDFLEIPTFPFGGPFSISVWVKNHNISAHYARIIDFFNGAGDDNIVLTWIGSTGRMKLDIFNVESRTLMETQQVFPENEWVHVAAVVDEGNIGYLYWNGTLIKTGPLEMPWTTQRAFHWLGRSAWSFDEYYDGLMDELIIFDRALSADEIELLSQGIVEKSDWVSSDPISGTIATNSVLPVQVTIDTRGLLPDVYNTFIYISGNDPLIPLIKIPITLRVTPSESEIYFPHTASARPSDQTLSSSNLEETFSMLPGWLGLMFVGIFAVYIGRQVYESNPD